MAIRQILSIGPRCRLPVYQWAGSPKTSMYIIFNVATTDIVVGIVTIDRQPPYAYTRAFMFNPSSSLHTWCTSSYPRLRCCTFGAHRRINFPYRGAGLRHFGTCSLAVNPPLASRGKMAGNDIIVSEENCRLLDQVQANRWMFI